MPVYTTEIVVYKILTKEKYIFKTSIQFTTKNRNTEQKYITNLFFPFFAVFAFYEEKIMAHKYVYQFHLMLSHDSF